MDSTSEEALRRDASAWFARMQGPDADRYRLEFERWRAADPARRLAYERLEAVWRVSARLGETSLRRERTLSRRHVWAGMTPGWRYAIGAFVVVLLAVTSWLSIQHLSNGEAALGLEAQVATPVGSLHTVRLADGSSVTLDTDSAMSVAFGKSQRLIHLAHGRARFDVAHDAQRPFVVDAAGSQVTARGTLFDVDLTRPAMRVTLYRGAVDVGSSKGAAVSVAHLVPGQRFTAASADAAPSVLPAPSGEDRWASGMLSFDNEPLADVIAQANRYTTHSILLGDPHLSGLRVTGAFRSGDSEALARSLAATFNLQVQQSPERNWILVSG